MGLSDYLPDGVKDEAVRIAKSAADGMKAGGFPAAVGKIVNTGFGDFSDAMKTAAASRINSVVSPVLQFAKTAVTGDPTPPFSGNSEPAPTQGRNVSVAGKTPPKFVPSFGPVSVPDSSGNAATGIAPYQSALNVKDTIGADGNPLRAAAYAPTSYAPPPVATPTTIPGVVDNDGSWSTRIANHNARKDFAAIQSADVARIGANATAQNANTNAFSANTTASRTAAENELTSANVKGAGVKQYGEALDNATKLKVANLQNQFLKETDPKKKEALQLQMLALQGKDTTQDKYQQIQTFVGTDPITQQPIYKSGLFNTRTGEFVEPKTSSTATSKYVEGKMYKDDKGNQAMYKNGKFEAVK